MIYSPILRVLTSLALGLTAAPSPAANEPLPILTLDRDNVTIDRSCRVRVAPDAEIIDADGNGVLHVAADHIIIEFDPATPLRGCPPGTPPDEMTGIGIRIDGRTGVTLRGARLSGFKCAILVTDSPGFIAEDLVIDDIFRQRLRSTPEAEDGADWLWPHRNDNHEWRNQYGAALCVERSNHVTIHNVKVRNAQNGIILDRVNNARVYDNDCSFLSGWGLALWRSSSNTITRNALDFCVRGYSHKVYNRGQDSAGLLLFEQCSHNIIAENSITHGGDGVFAFAGHEALGEAPPPRQDFDYARRGCNQNLFHKNDLSYAVAHGLELTFSFNNTITANRFVENAICGIWGGYSQDTTISHNRFERNGDMAYGLERGGINIEHGYNNRVTANDFIANPCAVHLWYDNDEALLKSPWAKANHRGSVDNHLTANTFTDNKIDLQLRKSLNTTFLARPGQPPPIIRAEPADTAPLPQDHNDTIPPPRDATAIGNTRPVGARANLRGRDKIIMTEWGPWDHQSPLVRRLDARGSEHRFELFGVSPAHVHTSGVGINAGPTAPVVAGQPWTLAVRAATRGIFPYTITVNAPTLNATRSGQLISTTWDTTFFSWSPSTHDPRADLESWRALARSDNAVPVSLDELRLPYGSAGPATLPAISPDDRKRLADAGITNNHFGMIARTSLRIPAGQWLIRTTSDDGVRVLFDNTPVIDNWTWHAPTRDEGDFNLLDARDVTITVEHFEIDGHAVLELELIPVQNTPRP